LSITRTVLIKGSVAETMAPINVAASRTVRRSTSSILPGALPYWGQRRQQGLPQRRVGQHRPQVDHFPGLWA
jgi:hypothetical protein